MLWLNLSSVFICRFQPWIMHCNIKQKSQSNNTLAYVCYLILIFPYIPRQNVDFLIPNTHTFPWSTLSGHRKDVKFSKLSSKTTHLCTSQSKPQHPPPPTLDMWGFSGALSPYLHWFPSVWGILAFCCFCPEECGYK